MTKDTPQRMIASLQARIPKENVSFMATASRMSSYYVPKLPAATEVKHDLPYADFDHRPRGKILSFFPPLHNLYS